MKKHICLLIVVLLVSVPLFGFTVTVPNEIPEYENLLVILDDPEEDGAVGEARFYIVKEGEKTPLFAEFTEKEGIWSTIIPISYLTGEELVYFTEIRTTDGPVVRLPFEGENRAVLIPDTKPPILTLVSHETPELGRGVEQLVVFRIEEESGVSQFEILYNGSELTKAAVFDNYLSFLVTPDENQEEKEASIEITISDLYDNEAQKEVSFTLKEASTPFFTASAGYTAGLDIKYTVSFGENQNSLVFMDLFNDITQEFMLSLKLGAETELTAGPLAIALSLGISDELAVAEILNAYPSTLISDYQNILRLWHPWDFANEFTYTGADVRKYDNSNNIFAKLSLFDTMLTYTFGDQNVNFQDQTIKSLGFRGTAVSLDIPFLSISVAKGLTDLGLYQVSWPQNFFGLKAGIDVFDYWWLQTNVSFISSFQGRYDDITTAGSSPIGTLYDLGSVNPEENMLIGLETGLNIDWFKLTGGLGLTLYVNDASQVIDTAQLASDINSGFGFDIAPYLGYIDIVETYFPVFDYFPITMGLAASAVNRELWGVTYGGALEIPIIGLQTWFQKTDKSYKSLGSSVSSDIMDLGISWEMSLIDFSFSAGYNWVQDNIPDILFYDILPLFSLDFRSTADPTDNDISSILHTVAAGVVTPTIDLLGNITLDYTFEWEMTNTEALAETITAPLDKAALLLSSKNDVSITHIADVKWKSGKIKFGDFSASIGAKTKDSYTVFSIVDGLASTDAYWGLSYGINTSMKISRYKLDLGYEQSWSTEASSDSDYNFDVKFSVSDIFFDAVTLKGTLAQTYNTASLQEYGISGKLSMNKSIGMFNFGLSFDTSYKDSIIDNSKDALSSIIEISGGISL